MNPASVVVLFLKLGFINYCCGELTPELIEIREQYDPLRVLPESDLIAISYANEKGRNMIAEMVFERRKLLLQSTVRQFTCAVGRVKNIIQHYYHEEDIKNLPINESYTDFPEFHYTLIYRQARKDSRTKETYFKENCAKWYTYIQDQSYRKSIRIRSNLLNYYNLNPAKYDNNITLLHVTFCASMSRCERVFNFISLELLPQMDFVKDYYGKSGNEFSQFLFENMKFYFLDEDDLGFIHILMRSENDKNELNEKHQLTFTTRQNPYLGSLLDPEYAKLHYKAHIYEKIEHGEVLIPLSSACLEENVESTKKAIFVP
ncbi:uncharacterized protein LOC135841928 [Planococcus citri]|uniref:uncharacterized protein LOC135841928 n=1 Tax=Planococcus citri TaxID=170843 RepID=UPI0031F88B1D